ncbi:MAG TPA: DUF1559 domain-containing protein [Tepidisphaeraceae bacterium]|nr:DUF1559 domain-containing protein [Tepidisphaeraceae bacterium]
MIAVPTKWWQWSLAGLIAGALFAIGRVMSLQNEPVGGSDFLSQRFFQQMLHMHTADGRPYIQSITIYRRRYIDVLSLDLFDDRAKVYAEHRLAAPRPYLPGDGSVPARSIQEYLSATQHTMPDVSIEYAWWDEAWAMLLIWALAGAAPGAIWGLTRYLFAEPRPKVAPDCSNVSGVEGDQAQAAKPAVLDSDLRHLEELEAEMIAALRLPVAQSPPRAPDPGPPEIRELSCEEPVPQQAAALNPVEYAGEYYPVHKKGRHGWTLIELLVVLGIITLLVSLLLPALVTAQRHAETVQCAENLRQVGIALQMYAQSNHGWLPAWSGWHTWPPGLSDDSPGPAWTIELMPYLGPPDSRVYRCPSFRSRVKCRNYFLAAKWSGMNGRHAMKLTDVKLSSRFVLSGDKTQRSLYPPPFGTDGHAQDDADPDDYSAQGPPVLAWPWDPGGFYMHPNGNNVLFDDMHVALFPSYDRGAMTFSPIQMQDWEEVMATTASP